jgi:Pyridoxamine 5'-phosphate oxidase
MTAAEPVAEPLIADLPATPWTTALQRLEKPERDRTYWLATVGSDDLPHVVPLLGLWLDDAFYFITGRQTRKGRNLARDPHCVLIAGSTTLPALDLSIEGEAVPVTDQATLQKVVDAYGETMKWPLTIEGTEVNGPSAPTAGPPPYTVYALTPTTVYGLPGVAGTEQGVGKAGSINPTRWRF